MYREIYKIAEITVEIVSIYPDIQKLCEKYKSESEPELQVKISQSDINFEHQNSMRESQIEGNCNARFSDAYLETLAVHRKITEYLLQKHNIMLFHGSAIAVDGYAYLFTAPSGTGKSTHTRLWRELLGDRAIMVNDDKPFLKITSDGVWVCGSPWNGKHHLGNNITVPLRAICILERGASNKIEQISPKSALPILLQQSYRPLNAKNIPNYLALLDQITQSLRFYRLRCNMNPDAAKLSYGVMSQNRKEFLTGLLF